MLLPANITTRTTGRLIATKRRRFPAIDCVPSVHALTITPGCGSNKPLDDRSLKRNAPSRIAADLYQKLELIDAVAAVVEVVVTNYWLAQRKIALYAEAGAPIYWLVDVPRRQVTVYEGPHPNGTWDRTTVVPESGELQLPGLATALPVVKILPPA